MTEEVEKMKCTECGEPVREAKLWEKVINPPSFILNLQGHNLYLHKTGYGYGDKCSLFQIDQNVNFSDNLGLEANGEKIK